MRHHSTGGGTENQAKSDTLHDRIRDLLLNPASRASEVERAERELAKSSRQIERNHQPHGEKPVVDVWTHLQRMAKPHGWKTS